jgi:hypothetical protein
MLNKLAYDPKKLTVNMRKWERGACIRALLYLDNDLKLFQYLYEIGIGTLLRLVPCLRLESAGIFHIFHVLQVEPHDKCFLPRQS